MSTHLRSLLLVVFFLFSTSLAAAEADWRQKVDPWVFARAGEAAQVEFLVVLTEQADLSAVPQHRGKEAKGAYVVEKLRQVQERTQPAIWHQLEARHLPYRSFYIANMIWVRGTLADAEALARRSDVSRLTANPSVPMERPFLELSREPHACPVAISPGVVHTLAPDLWSQGADGTGAVVAGADTGYAWEHPALKNAYRGFDGTSADHAYNWHDAVHSGGGVCGANSAVPCDDNNHGTHTLGTMLGNNGSQITGMAPGARWMACRNMDRGNGTPATYAECYEFFLAPTDTQNQNADPAMAPDVINNSWGCPPSEGCTDPNALKTVIENVRAAGIVVVSSAGNSGSGCSSIDTPSAIYDAVFTVGATDNSDNIAGFSSRGPVTVDGSTRAKPDISAPGVSVCSTVPAGYSEGFSGTSMASPHVAGLVALLISAQPCLRGEVEAIENYIKQTAVPRTSGQSCTIPGTEVPNNTYGWGAIRAVLPGPEVCPALFTDGFESGDLSAWSL